MQMPFPGSPDHIRMLLAQSTFDLRAWVGFVDYLQVRFAGLQVSASRIQQSTVVRSQRAVSELNASSGQTAEPLFESSRNGSVLEYFAPSSRCERASCSFELELPVTDYAIYRLKISFPQSCEATYKRPLEVLIRHIRPDLEAALCAEADLEFLSVAARERLESIWTRVPYGVVLVSKEKRILALNPNMEHLLSERRTYRPSGVFGALRFRDAQRNATFSEAVDSVATGVLSSVRIRNCNSEDAQILEIRRPGRNTAKCRDAVVVTARPVG